MDMMVMRPAPETVAVRAREILAVWEADPEFGRLWQSCARYQNDWTCVFGYTVVENYDTARDAEPLFTETMRCMAMKSAVYEATGDEKAAELPVPVAVDEMSHALAAQFTLASRIQDRTGIRFVHATDMEEGVGGGTWDHGDYTHQVYKAAFGNVPARYWIGAAETDRRRKILDTVFAQVGVTDRGKKVAIDFGGAAPAVPA